MCALNLSLNDWLLKNLVTIASDYSWIVVLLNWCTFMKARSGQNHGKKIASSFRKSACVVRDEDSRYKIG